jgi:hypothetical protein
MINPSNNFILQQTALAAANAIIIPWAAHPRYVRQPEDFNDRNDEQS